MSFESKTSVFKFLKRQRTYRVRAGTRRYAQARAGTHRRTETRANFPDFKNGNSNRVRQLTAKPFFWRNCKVGL